MTVAFIRTIILYISTMLAVRLMGKRQIGELEPMDLVVTIFISELATIPMQDIESPLLNSLIPISVLVVLQIFNSVLSLKSRFFQVFFSGKRCILINDGVLQQKEMKKAHIATDELLEKIRQNGALNINEVRYCILETSGNMSVLLIKDTEAGALPVILITDGKIMYKNLSLAGLNEDELKAVAAEKGYTSLKDIFLMYTANGKYEFIEKQKDK